MTFFIVNAGLPPGELNGAANNPFQHVSSTHSKIGKVRRSKYGVDCAAVLATPHFLSPPFFRFSSTPAILLFSDYTPPFVTREPPAAA